MQHDGSRPDPVTLAARDRRAKTPIRILSATKAQSLATRIDHPKNKLPRRKRNTYGRSQHTSKPRPAAPKRFGAGGRGPRTPQNFMSRGFFGWIMLIGLVIIMIVVMNGYKDQYHSVDQKQFLTWAKGGHLEDPVIVENEVVRGTLKDKTEGIDALWGPKPHVATKIGAQTKERYWTELTAAGVAVKEEPGESILIPLLVSYGPFILIILLVYFFVFRSIRAAGGGRACSATSAAPAPRPHQGTHQHHLRRRGRHRRGQGRGQRDHRVPQEPRTFQRLGGRIPRGVLLVGEPGCGKTLLAKAIAGEADVPFFTISGSDFVEMFVGVGASRVRDLFKQAKESSPCIIFLDEIDAVGPARAACGLNGGGHDEREQTLNAILVEMDGFDTNDQVIVIAATNRADVLDPALTRPGPLRPPDQRAAARHQGPLRDPQGPRRARSSCGPDVDLHAPGPATPMFSGADLAAIINEAAIAATMPNKDCRRAGRPGRGPRQGPLGPGPQEPRHRREGKGHHRLPRGRATPCSSS